MSENMSLDDGRMLKVMITGGGYMQNNMVMNMINWKDYGCRAFMEISGGIGVLKLSRIEPDILILLDNVCWTDRNIIIDRFANIASNKQIILISSDLSKFNSEKYDGIQKIDRDYLDEKRLAAALVRASISNKEKRHNSSDRLIVGDLRRLKRIMAGLSSDKVVLIQFEIESERNADGIDEDLEQIEELFSREVENKWFHEVMGKYLLCLEIFEGEMSYQLRWINETVARLRAKTYGLVRRHIVVYISRIIGRDEAIVEYGKLKELERYRFFLADRAVVSHDLIKREITGGAVDWDFLDKKYDEILRCALEGQREQLFAVLKLVFFEHIMRTGSEKYYRIVMVQLFSILKLLEIIMCPNMIGRIDFRFDFWKLGDAMEHMSEKFSLLMANSRVSKKGYSPHVIKTLITISRDYGKPIYVGYLAEKAGVSESYLSRAFKEQTGMGISKCINYVRVYCSSMELVRENAKISDVAKAHGFNDAKYFSKIFRRIMGATPSEWRNKNVGV